MNKDPAFTQAEVAQIRLDCARGIAEIEAGLGEELTPELLARMELEVDDLLQARQRDRGR